MFWTVFWNTSQPYSLFIIFHSLDLLPGFEVEFSNVSAQPPLRATIRSIGPALPPQRAPWEMLRAFLEDSWEGPLVWLAEPLPSVLRLWRPSLPWSRLGLAPLVGTLPGSLSKTIRHHSQKGYPAMAHKCGWTIRIFAQKGTSVLVYSALGRLSKEVPNIIMTTGIEQKEHSIDGAHILRIVLFVNWRPCAQTFTDIFINVFLHTKMFALFETSVFQACAASEGYRWDGVCRLHRHTARVFGCIFVLGCEDQWRWRATYPCWHCLQG